MIPAFQFNFADALLCAQLSQMAYDEPPTISGTATDTQVIIREFPDKIVVAFRGTSDMKDWFTDARCWRVPLINTNFIARPELHYGFLTAYRSVEDGLIDHLAAKQLPIWFAGHSLGGAEAQIAAYELREILDIGGIYTFGQPRIGNEAFAEGYFDAGLWGKTIRVVNQEDIVPRLPGVLAGYHHAGNCAFISSDGELEINPPLWRMLASDLHGAIDDWVLRRGVSALKNHSISDYIAELQSLAHLPVENFQPEIK